MDIIRYLQISTYPDYQPGVLHTQEERIDEKTKLAFSNTRCFSRGPQMAGPLYLMSRVIGHEEQGIMGWTFLIVYRFPRVMHGVSLVSHGREGSRGRRGKGSCGR